MIRNPSALLLLGLLLGTSACGPGDDGGGIGPGERALICEAPADLGPVATGSVGEVEVPCAAASRVDVRILEVMSTPPFAADLPHGDEVSGGGHVPVRVRFAPTTPGLHEAEVTVRYLIQGSDEGTASFPVRGLAVGDRPFDAAPAPPGCRATGEAPLLDQVLALARLSRATFGMADLSGSEMLDDPFRLSWFPGVRAAAAEAGCFEGAAAGALDAHLASPHPVAGMIRHAARLLDREMDGGPAIASQSQLLSWDAALLELCTGGAGPCGAPTGELPADLGAALAPLLVALEEGIAARAAMTAEDDFRSAAFWYRNGGNDVLGSNALPDPLRESDRRYLLGAAGRRRLHGAAARIAFAVESIDWSRFRDRTGVRYDLETAAGAIRVRDAAADTYPDDGTATLLLVDLGGDDVHLDPAASNRDEANPVSVAVDLGGADRYGYEPVESPHHREGLLPADADGRDAPAGNRGPVSLSTRSRQGAARNGIALLFDLGAGNDRYESLRASQGYAHQGVGVLFDGGGDDVYRAEAAAQGAGVYGIGLLVDAGAGRDERTAFTYAQGFAYVGGAGFLVDGGGDDVYRCDPGSAGGGQVLYPSAQMTADGNNSFCQGAGFGMRRDAKSLWLSGGLGILRDAGGDDAYTASVFAQGTGYWQGTGILSDGGGADRYESFWYVQGGAAHFAVGILADAGPGNDVFGRELRTRNMSMGAGHDFSLGVLLDEAGDDEYHLGTLAGGASHCNGVGVLVDAGGNDRYLAFSDYGGGMGNVGAECQETRPDFPSIGILLDGGGIDVYEWPASDFPVPSDGGSWGHARKGLASEHGGGLDGSGEVGMHPESAADAH